VTSCLLPVWRRETIRVCVCVGEGGHKSFSSRSPWTVYDANPCACRVCHCLFWSKTIQVAYLPDASVLGALALRLLSISYVENELCLLHA
jgi:hypothetical protein